MRESFAIGVILFVVGIFIAPPIGTAVFWVISALCFHKSYKIYHRQMSVEARSSIAETKLDIAPPVQSVSAVNPFVATFCAEATPNTIIRDSILKQYGLMDGSYILSQCLRPGMTEEMVRLSFGEPEDVSVQVSTRSRTETWKYDQIGKNRFRVHIHLKDGIVVRWKDGRSTLSSFEA